VTSRYAEHRACHCWGFDIRFLQQADVLRITKGMAA
jgi:hypothetical protein